MEPIYGKNNKEELPLEFYVKRFQAGDPAEMAARCALPWDEETKTIAMTLLGEPFTVSHPDFTVAGPRALSNPERILLLRYLLDGRCAMPTGQYLTYREFPWGEVYLQQFTGRCVKRFAFSYGGKPELLLGYDVPMVDIEVGSAEESWGLQPRRIQNLRLERPCWYLEAIRISRSAST